MNMALCNIGPQHGQQAGWFKQCLKIKKADMPNPIEENNNFFTCAQ